MAAEDTMTIADRHPHPADLWNLALSVLAVSVFGAALVWLVSL